MSDLTATQCGCQRSDSNGCGSILWIIILLSLCGCNGNDSGCGGGLLSSNGDGGCESILILILLLSCCGGCSF